MSAVRGFEHGDVWVGFDCRACCRGEADKGIVAGVQQQGRHRDAVEHAGRCGTIVVIVSGTKAGIKRCDAVVELAQRGDVVADLRVEGMWKQQRLATKTPQQGAQERPARQPA